MHNSFYINDSSNAISQMDSKPRIIGLGSLTRDRIRLFNRNLNNKFNVLKLFKRDERKSR